MLKKLRVRRCPEQRCIEYYNEDTGDFVCGTGPVDCSCQNEVKYDGVPTNA